MKNIAIYDTEFEFFEKIADQEDTTVAEVVADVVEGFKIHVLDMESSLKGEKA